MVVKTTLMNEKEEDVKKPIKVFRSGQVKASIWENEYELKDGTKRKGHSVSVNRSYKDGDDWKDTNSYNVDSLADLELVAKTCREYLKLKDK